MHAGQQVPSASGVKKIDTKASSSGATKPDWADGLKRLYDSVVDEPLPDDLASLLARLDDSGAA